MSNPTKLSRAQQIRAKRDGGIHDLPLPVCGVTARVRRLSIFDLVEVGAIPHELESVVERYLTQGMAGNNAEQTGLDEVLREAGGAVAALRGMQGLADAACLRGFVDPVVVAGEAELTDPDNQVLLTDLDRNDRMAYWLWLQGQEQTDANRVAAVFPQPVAAAETGPAEPTVRRHAHELAVVGAG